jgi:hypothetical protein
MAAEVVDYFDYNASRRREPAVSWEVVEVEPVLVAETDDETEVEKVKWLWLQRVQTCS